MSEQGTRPNETLPLPPEQGPDRGLTASVSPSTEGIAQELPHQVAPAEVRPVETNVVTSSTPEQLRQTVERVMAKGMEQVYASMEPSVQTAFKSSGEQTAQHIADLLRAPRPPVQRLIDQIVGWLQTIPTTNPYYLEQEAKIKTAAILALRYSPRSGMVTEGGA